MKIAVIGAGIAGLTAALELRRSFRPTVFEAEGRPGGHSNTIDARHGGRDWPVDTGFIVFNDRTYPGFVRLLAELGVASRPADMTFSVRHEPDRVEYNGHSLSHLLTWKRNALRPGFWRMARDIIRLGRDTTARLASGGDGLEGSLAEFLRRGRYSRELCDWYLAPMTSAIWSSSHAAALETPAIFFARFFANHGFFDMGERPLWRTVVGGSRAYVRAIAQRLGDDLRTGCPALRVERPAGGGVIVESPAGSEHFDAAVIASHSDQALGLLADPTDDERDVLGSIPYTDNLAILHTDTSLLPARPKAWAAWNARVGHDSPADPARVTYNLSILQGLAPPDGTQFLVTLNPKPGEIEPGRILRRINYHHPAFDRASVAAQARHARVSAGPTFYAGAYWRYGFHEDGHWSGARAALQVEAFARRHAPAARPQEAPA
ncbi:MAG: FAD-dependent oxidoreductase [Phycisphaeraceae bacterium]|nr:MAG: FAD-dependent oxidoreductase [Phycisphaeraceae bacterium]